MTNYQGNLSQVSDEQLEKYIAEVNATMAIEGMAFTELDKELIRKYARGEYTIEDVIKAVRESWVK